MERDFKQEYEDFYGHNIGSGVDRIQCYLRYRGKRDYINLTASDYFWDINNPTKEELALFDLEYPRDKFSGFFIDRIHSLADNV